MTYSITEESLSSLQDYGSVSIAFQANSVLRVSPIDGGLSGFAIQERPVTPYVKNYDLTAGSPTSWKQQFEGSDAVIFGVFEDNHRVAGALVARQTKEPLLPGHRPESAVIWDLRVDAHHRSKGLGKALFARVEQWARQKGAERLEVETQNTNVAACRFYARQGCVLVSIDRYAYPHQSEEIQMIWAKSLSDSGPGDRPTQ